MKTKKLTVADLKRMIHEVKQEEKSNQISEAFKSPWSGDPGSRSEKAREMEKELEALYMEPIENADLIHDLELDLDDLYAEMEQEQYDIDIESAENYKNDY